MTLPPSYYAFCAAAGGGGDSGDKFREFWEKEKGWQDGVLGEPFVVSVSEPEKISQMLSSYVVYTVRSPLSPPEGVKRRYSDFDWLRMVLVARFHGVAVPLLPEKRAVGNQGEAFVAERMRALDKWLKQVVAQPYLRKDVTLGVFMSTAGHAEFEQAKRAVAQGAGSNPADNPGLARWFGCLRAFQLPEDADTAITELDAMAAEAEGTAAATLEAVAKYWSATRAMTDALRGVGEALGEYGRVASDRAGALSDTLAPCRADVGAVGEVASKASEAWSATRDLSMFSVNEVQLFLMDALAREVTRAQSLRALLAVRRAAQEAFTRAWHAEDRLRFEEKTLRDKGRAEQADQLRPRIAAAERETRQMKERVEDVTKGALLFESRAAAALRNERIRAALGQFTRLCMESSRKQGEVWRSFLDEAALDPAEMERQAEAVLMMDKRERPTFVPLPTGPDERIRVGAARTMRAKGPAPLPDSDDEEDAPAAASGGGGGGGGGGGESEGAEEGVATDAGEEEAHDGDLDFGAHDATDDFDVA